MDEDGSLPVPPASGGAAVSTYVSLFLLLFVFFIVLVSISKVQQPRERAVLESIDAAFGHLPSSLGVIPPASVLRPETGSVEGFARDVSGLLTGFAPLARTVTTAPNDSFLEIALPEDAVFPAGSVTPKPDVLPTLDRLALLMQKRPTGPAVRLTWRATLPADVPEGGPAERLAGLRMATVVARLFAEGCPGDALAIAIEHGDGPALRLDFSVIDADLPAAGATP